jgi:hypothetical protein
MSDIDHQQRIQQTMEVKSQILPKEFCNVSFQKFVIRRHPFDEGKRTLVLTY